MKTAKIRSARLYATPANSGDGYSFGGAAVLCLEADVTDAGGSYVYALAVNLGEAPEAFALGNAIVDLCFPSPLTIDESQTGAAR